MFSEGSSVKGSPEDKQPFGLICQDFTAGHSSTLHLQLPTLDMPLAAAAAWSVHSFRQKILYAAMPIHVYIEN